MFNLIPFFQGKHYVYIIDHMLDVYFAFYKLMCYFAPYFAPGLGFKVTREMATDKGLIDRQTADRTRYDNDIAVSKYMVTAILLYNHYIKLLLI